MEESKIFCGTGGSESLRVAETVIQLEKAALAEWYKGNPARYLDLYDPDDFTYFDPARNARVDGFDAIKGVYAGIKGTIFSEDYEMINPRVQVCSDMAVLTYNLHARMGDKVIKWNCTEVYRLRGDGSWNMIHSHWGFVRPMDMVFDTGKDIN